MATVLMTGGHGGLGRAAARTLAERFGCDLILTGSNVERIEGVARELRTTTGVRIDLVELDLSDLASVRAGAALCIDLLRSRRGEDRSLAALVCNAGVQSRGPICYSVDGYEKTFAINCLGHFLLVDLLIEELAQDGRVVWTSSGTHDPATMDGRSVGAAVEPAARSLAQQGRDGRPISGGRRYATSKLCIILYAYELDRRLRRAGSAVTSVAYDPGFLPETGMGRMAPSFLRSAPAKFVLRKLGMTMGEMPFSGEALALLAADPMFSSASGKYFQSKDGRLRESRSSSASYDQGAAAKLWRETEQLTGVIPGWLAASARVSHGQCSRS